MTIQDLNLDTISKIEFTNTPMSDKIIIHHRDIVLPETYSEESIYDVEIPEEEILAKGGVKNGRPDFGSLSIEQIRQEYWREAPTVLRKDDTAIVPKKERSIYESKIKQRHKDWLKFKTDLKDWWDGSIINRKQKLLDRLEELKQDIENL